MIKTLNSFSLTLLLDAFGKKRMIYSRSIKRRKRSQLLFFILRFNGGKLYNGSEQYVRPARRYGKNYGLQLEL